jgi:hypothetical protein
MFGAGFGGNTAGGIIENANKASFARKPDRGGVGGGIGQMSQHQH